MEFDLRERIFLVPVADKIYYRVKQRAELEQRSLKEMIGTFLERELA